jgi:hypothetical protein
MLTNPLPPLTFIWSKNDNIIPFYVPELFINLLKINNKKTPKIIILPNNKHGFSIGDASLLYRNIIHGIKISTNINLITNKNKIQKLNQLINEPLKYNLNVKKNIIDFYKKIYNIMLHK